MNICSIDGKTRKREINRVHLSLSSLLTLWPSNRSILSIDQKGTKETADPMNDGGTKTNEDVDDDGGTTGTLATERERERENPVICLCLSAQLDMRRSTWIVSMTTVTWFQLNNVDKVNWGISRQMLMWTSSIWSVWGMGKVCLARSIELVRLFFPLLHHFSCPFATRLSLSQCPSHPRRIPSVLRSLQSRSVHHLSIIRSFLFGQRDLTIGPNVRWWTTLWWTSLFVWSNGDCPIDEFNWPWNRRRVMSILVAMLNWFLISNRSTMAKQSLNHSNWSERKAKVSPWKWMTVTEERQADRSDVEDGNDSHQDQRQRWTDRNERTRMIFPSIDDSPLKCDIQEKILGRNSSPWKSFTESTKEKNWSARRCSINDRFSSSFSSRSLRNERRRRTSGCCCWPSSMMGNRTERFDWKSRSTWEMWTIIPPSPIRSVLWSISTSTMWRSWDTDTSFIPECSSSCRGEEEGHFKSSSSSSSIKRMEKTRRKTRNPQGIIEAFDPWTDGRRMRNKHSVPSPTDFSHLSASAQPETRDPSRYVFTHPMRSWEISSLWISRLIFKE